MRTSWVNDARKLYFWSVLDMGKLTEPWPWDEGCGTVGARQPNYSRVCELLKQTGPLTGTSAIRSGQPPAQLAEEVMVYMGSDIDLMLSCGQTPGGKPSTVLQFDPEFRILRQGAISQRIFGTSPTLIRL